MIEVVALAGALADAGEHRIAAMRLGHVVDQLHDQHGLADAGAAEQADLAALGVRREQIDDLDAGDQDLCLGRLIDIGGRRRMDRPLLRGLDRASLVNRLADHVHDAAQGLVADGNRDRLAGIDHLLAAHQALGRIHGDGAHRALAEMLGDFEHEPVALIVGLRARSGSRAGARRTARRPRRPSPGAHGPWRPCLRRCASLASWSRRPRGICVPYRCSLHLETRAPRRRK